VSDLGDLETLIRRAEQGYPLPVPETLALLRRLLPYSRPTVILPAEVSGMKRTLSAPEEAWARLEQLRKALGAPSLSYTLQRAVIVALRVATAEAVYVSEGGELVRLEVL
jgi:hypothetical protein